MLKQSQLVTKAQTLVITPPVSPYFTLHMPTIPHTTLHLLGLSNLPTFTFSVGPPTVH